MADIIFYPQHVAAFTITAITSEATGFEKELILDRRLATYWKATSTANQDIEIDLGADYADHSISSLVFLVYLNSTDDWGLYADENSDYSGEEMVTEGSSGTTGWQTIVATFTATSAFRYWRIKLYSLIATPRIATIYLGPHYTITCRYNKNQIESEYDYSGVKLETAYGGEVGATEQYPERKYWRFLYETLDVTNKGYLDSILALSKGKKYPIAFSDINGTEYYIRFMIDRLNARQVEHQLYNTGEILLQEEYGDPT